MNKYECNSFTVDCFEICPIQITHNKKFVPCLAHSLLFYDADKMLVLF
jgi:hypothetical protein